MEQRGTLQALRKHKMKLSTKQKSQSQMAVETSEVETASMLGQAYA